MKRVHFSADALRRIRQHARSSISTEICGVLIGGAEDGATVVEASIEGEAALQAGSHVTFTQDTWSHIYQVKDAEYPDRRIVGWYHSHPGFGIFLSDHDTFIHRNFFSGPDQIAWVFDPVSDEEGCFGWESDEIVRLSEVSVRYDVSVAITSAAQEAAPTELEPARPVERPSGRFARWFVLAVTHLLLFLIGVGAGALFFARVVVLPSNGEVQPK